MDDQDLSEKLGNLGYDFEKKVKGTPTDVFSICRGHLNGLILFNGRVEARSGFTTVLEDDHLYVTHCKIVEEGTLYISPLQKRIKEEYIRIGSIQINDLIKVEEKVIGNIDSFSLIIKDARKNNVATIEFYNKQGDMLYVPKRS